MINPSPLWGFGRGGSGGGGVSEARALGIYELIKSCGIEVRIWERQVAGAPRRAPCDLVDASPHRAGSLNFYHPEMQTALLASAEHSGATVKRAVTVLEVIPGDRPRVRARDDGREQTYSANLVIGADGRNSRCRHWIGCTYRSCLSLDQPICGRLEPDRSFGRIAIQGLRGNFQEPRHEAAEWPSSSIGLRQREYFRGSAFGMV